MTTESELYTWTFWKSALARSISVAAIAASSVLVNAQIHNLKDAPWSGTLSTAVMSGLILLLGLIGGATIRDAAPGTPATTRQALAALRPTGRHAKPEDDETGA